MGCAALGKPRAGVPAYLLCILALAPAFVGTRPAAAEPLVLEIIAAEAAIDLRTKEPVVSFRMSAASAQAFAQLTRENIGRQIDIRVDGKSVMKPFVREPILGGMGQIAALLSQDQANALAARMATGQAKVEVEAVRD
jgi:preprotein translocase subunit SecD